MHGTCPTSCEHASRFERGVAWVTPPRPPRDGAPGARARGRRAQALHGEPRRVRPGPTRALYFFRSVFFFEVAFVFLPFAVLVDASAWPFFFELVDATFLSGRSVPSAISSRSPRTFAR